MWKRVTTAIVVALVAVLGPPFVQMQKDLTAASARISELEIVVANLKRELDAANQAQRKLQGALDEANSEVERRQFEVERLTTELEEAHQLAKDAEALGDRAHQGDSASEPSDRFRQPQ